MQCGHQPYLRLAKDTEAMAHGNWEIAPLIGRIHALVHQLWSREIVIRVASLSFQVAFGVAVTTIGSTAVTMAAEVVQSTTYSRAVLRDSLKCGPNATFLFLRLLGLTPQIEKLDSIDCSNEGASLLQLKNVVEDHGVAVEVRHFAPPEYGRINLPAICLTSEAKGSYGIKHFVVIYKSDSSGLHMIDSTDGLAFVLRPGRFDYLSGYALVPKNNSLTSVIGGHYALLILCWGALAIFIGPMCIRYLLPTKSYWSSAIRKTQCD